jgi:predicted nucleic acid-binding protein
VAALPTVDISHDTIVKTYAEIDASGVKAGANLGQNDVWIAAVTRVLQGVLLTTDRDFERLEKGQIELEFVDPANLKAGSLQP